MWLNKKKYMYTSESNIIFYNFDFELV